jgi:hypothetical protein
MTIHDLLQELEEEAQVTWRVLGRVREDQLGWTPHEKSMTLGQLAMHVASVPGAIAALSTQPVFDVKTPVPRPSAVSPSRPTHGVFAPNRITRAGSLWSERGRESVFDLVSRE